MEEEEEDKTEVVYLWKPCLKIFKVFLLSRLYLSSENTLDSRILLKLLRKDHLPLKKSLYDIQCLFTSYSIASHKFQEVSSNG